MNKRMKILLIAGAVMVLLLVAGYLKQQDRNSDGSQNSVTSIEAAIDDKTYTSKKAAYEAYANEKESFYNRPPSGFEPMAEHPEPSASKSENAQSAPVTTLRVDRKASEEQFDAAYEEIAQNMDQIYEGETPVGRSRQAASSAPDGPATNEQVVDEATRRRQAMMRDWGVGQSSQPGQGNTPGASMFRAVIHGTQLVKSGQTALFRTKEPIRYGSLIVPANTLLSGVAAISENRLSVKINSVRMGREVFSLPLAVYGSDGIQGIPLNYDEVGKIANSQTSMTAVQEASTAVSQYGGTVGRVVGSMISGVGNQVRSAKTVEIKLIDNQIVILKIDER